MDSIRWEETATRLTSVMEIKSRWEEIRTRFRKVNVDVILLVLKCKTNTIHNT